MLYREIARIVEAEAAEIAAITRRLKRQTTICTWVVVVVSVLSLAMIVALSR